MTNIRGPYLIDMSETAVTINWFTESDATGNVEYGISGVHENSCLETERGLVMVGKRHSVRIVGLTPGTTYRYRVVSTLVTELKAYFPVVSETVSSSEYTFTTFDDNKSSFSFYYMTDTHGDVQRINKLLTLGEQLVPPTDFVLHTGDLFNHVDSEGHILNEFFDPIISKFATTKPLVYAHGNHDMRGSYARHLHHYLPNSTGEWFYGFNHGPASFVVMDNAEDKLDDHLEYGGLIASESYREEVFKWFRSYVQSSVFQKNTFKVILQHQRNFGPVKDPSEWRELANHAGVQLMLVGHEHRCLHVPPGEQGNDYHTLVLGQDQIAQVTVTPDVLTVTVLNEDGIKIEGFEIGV